MAALLAGLLLFIGVHSLRIFADHRREQMIARHGENAWKGIFSLISIVGLILIIWGYGLSRADPVLLWNPPVWGRHLALPLTWTAFVLILAAYVPRNHFKQYLGHPMYAGIKIWALAHLLANGRVEDVILFGVFLVWAIVGFATSRRRDRRTGITYLPGEINKTLLCVGVGTVVWAAFVFTLHRWLIGVSPI